MAECLQKHIDVCRAIILNNRPTTGQKIDDIKKPLATINELLDSEPPNEGLISPEYTSKLMDIILFVLDKARTKVRRLSEALNIGRHLTRNNPITARDQGRLIKSIHMAYGVVFNIGDRDQRIVPMKRMVETVCNLVMGEGCNTNILSQQRSATTILSICSAGFKTAPEAAECSRLLKAVLMNWPSQFQGMGLIPGQKKATTSIVVSGSDRDWPNQKLKEFVQLALVNYKKLTQKQVEAMRGLRFAITRALSIDHKLVWKLLKEMHIDPEEFVTDHLDEWFEEIGANRQLSIENTILSCHLLLNMMSLDDGNRPLLYEHYIDQIIPKSVLLFGRLAERHRIVFTPDKWGSNRLEPCDRMIAQMLYKFVAVQTDDPDWHDKLMATITPELGSRLVNAIVAACTRRVFMVQGPEAKMLSMEPPDEHDETFWGPYHDKAFRILDGQQRASFGFHLRPNKTFEKL